jgi:3-hydroxybutyrate dehydrogenase
MPTLSDKSVFITGSDRGIGKAIALAFANAGSRVAVHGLATPDEAEAVVRELHDAGCSDARFFSGDLRNADEIDALMQHVFAWAGVDVLVNNAGIQRTGPIAAR